MLLQKWMQGLSLFYFSFKESFLISIIDSVSQLVIKLQNMVALDAEEGVLKTFYAMLVWKLNILNCMYKLISAFAAQKTNFSFIITPIEPKISPVIMLYKHSTMLAVKLQITVSQWQCHYATCICAIETGKTCFTVPLSLKIETEVDPESECLTVFVEL